MLTKIKAWLKEKGYFAKIQDKSITDDEWKEVEAKIKEKFGVTLAEATTQAEAAGLQEERDNFVAAVFAGDDDGAGDGDDDGAGDGEGDGAGDGEGDGAGDGDGDGEGDGEGDGDGAQSQTTKKKTTAQAVKEVKVMKKKIKKLGAEGESDEPLAKIKPDKEIMLCGPGHSKTHLFGIAHEMFAINNRWNKASVKMAANNERYSEDESDAFKTEFNTYAKSLGKRIEEIHAKGFLHTIMAGDFDYTNLQTDLGAYYQVRRQDALITFLKKMDSVSKIFPVRYNVQDEEIIVNAFQGKSYSGAYVPGKVSSGAGFGFEPDKAKVRDVMFKYLFKDLKDLEKQYIGYLNKEGSDPMKWGMIEWTLRQCAIIAHNEKEKRRIKGIRVEPTTGKMGHFMYGSDGVITHLNNLADASTAAKKVQVYEIATLKTYTTSTLLDYVKTFVRTVFRLRGNLAGYALYMNERDVPDLLELYRTKYGTDADFTGEKLEVKNFPLPKIVRVPNMDERQDMWLMKEEVVEIQENKPGEFYAHYFQRDMEQLWVASYGKEGVFAFAGKKYDTQAALQLEKGKFTNIFKNKPITVLDADATTVDALVNEMFQTIANTGAKAITDIENAVAGVLYKIECSDLTDATTIAKADKFSTLVAAYLPTAVGDYIKVIYDPTGEKFYTYAIKLGGVVTVNSALKTQEYSEA